MQPQENTMKDMVSSSFDDGKLSKHLELNHDMSIVPQGQDEYTKTLHNLGGKY